MASRRIARAVALLALSAAVLQSFPVGNGRMQAVAAAAAAAPESLEAVEPSATAGAARKDGSTGSGEKEKGSKSTLETLRSRSAASVSGAVRLSSSNYTQMVLNGPRDYGMLVLFVAQEAKYGCSLCPISIKELAIAAKTYARAVPEPSARDVFFALTDFSNNADAFAMHGFMTVPQAAYFPPTKEFVKLATTQARVPIPPAQLATGGETPMEAATYLALAGLGHLTPARPVSEQQHLSVLVAVVAAIAAALVAANRSNILFFKRRWFYVLVSLGVYAFSVSGAVSCIIRTPPWYTVGRDGKPVIFSPSSEQTVLEGVVIGALNLLAAGAVLLLVRTAKSKSKADSEFYKVLVAALAVGVFVAAYLRIMAQYQEKQRWYQASSLVPADLVRYYSVARKLVVDAFYKYIVSRISFT